MPANQLSLVVVLLVAQLVAGCSQVLDRLETDGKVMTSEGPKVGTLSEPDAKAQSSDSANISPTPDPSKKIDKSLTPLTGTKTKAEVDQGNTEQVKNRPTGKKEGSAGFSDTSRLNEF